jgi:hypothetical protein
LILEVAVVGESGESVGGGHAFHALVHLRVQE